MHGSYTNSIFLVSILKTYKLNKHILNKMAWKNPANPFEGIAPFRYHIENTGYRPTEQTEEKQVERDINRWVVELCSMWGDIRGWWLSGAVATARLTETYPRVPTNTDIALLREKIYLQQMIEHAAAHSLFLFRRTRAYKGLKELRQPCAKREVYFPVGSAEIDKVIRDFRRDRNYQFCLVDRTGQIVTRNTMYDRIRLYLHHQEGNSLISTEGDFGIKKIDPRFLSNEEVYREDRRAVRIVHPLYLKLIQERMLKSWRWRRNPKHRQDLERLEKLLSDKPEYAVLPDQPRVTPAV
jgi:hypothetical protein